MPSDRHGENSFLRMIMVYEFTLVFDYILLVRYANLACYLPIAVRFCTHSIFKMLLSRPFWYPCPFAYPFKRILHTVRQLFAAVWQFEADVCLANTVYSRLFATHIQRDTTNHQLFPVKWLNFLDFRLRITGSCWPLMRAPIEWYLSRYLTR